jgi:hypothetical protein
MPGEPIKDTLCGTNVLWAEDYRVIAANRSCAGDFDSFGDFDLLFGAARLGLKIVDMADPASETDLRANQHPARHRALLLRMLSCAAARLEFV